MILFSMSKNVLYDLNIKFTLNNNNGDNLDEEDGVPIPAGEEGVQLLTSFKFYNLYNTPLTNIKLELLFANKVELITRPDNCIIKTDDKYLLNTNIPNFNKTKYLYCELNSLEELSYISNTFKIEITDYTVTQNLNDISLIYSNIYYTLEGKEEILTPGIYYAQGQAAALLRGTINKEYITPKVKQQLYLEGQ